MSLKDHIFNIRGGLVSLVITGLFQDGVEKVTEELSEGNYETAIFGFTTLSIIAFNSYLKKQDEKESYKNFSKHY